MNLSEQEQDTLQIILSNELLLNAVRKVFFWVIETNRPEIGASDNNSLLGEKYRAYEISKQIIHDGFDKLKEFKRSEKSKEQINKAR